MPRTFTKINPKEVRANLRQQAVLRAEEDAHFAEQNLAQLDLLDKDTTYDKPEGFDEGLTQATKTLKDQKAKLKKLKDSLSVAQKTKATEAWTQRKEELKEGRITQLEQELAAHMELVEHSDLYGKTEEELQGHNRAIREIEAALTAADA